MPRKRTLLQLPAAAAMFLAWVFASTVPAQANQIHREEMIPVLGVSIGAEAVGTVAYLAVSFEERADRSGLVLEFRDAPGRFSGLAKASIEKAIRRTARALNLSTRSWTVILSVPYPGVVMYGESLSAMVGLSVAGMAEGRSLVPGVVMSGTITEDGRIGPVGSVPLKIAAAKQAHLRVLVSEPQEKIDGDQQEQLTFRADPIRGIREAFEALTDSGSTR